MVFSRLTYYRIWYVKILVSTISCEGVTSLSPILGFGFRKVISVILSKHLFTSLPLLYIHPIVSMVSCILNDNAPMERVMRTSKTCHFSSFQFTLKVGIVMSFLPSPLTGFPCAFDADVMMSGFVMSWVGSLILC